MSDYVVPLEKPKPDAESFIKALKGERAPDSPPLVEYLIDDSIMESIFEKYLDREWVSAPKGSSYIGCIGRQMEFSDANTDRLEAYLDNFMYFWHVMGYDFVRFEVSLPLPAASHMRQDTAENNENGERAWQDLEHGPITSWEDFENYPWPEVSDESFYIHRYIANNLREGSGLITCHAGGVYEHTSRLMGYKNLCMALYQQPDLVEAIVDKLGGLIRQYYDKLLEVDEIIAVFQGDDYGMGTQTLLSPKHLREHFLPWLKKFADLAHDRDLPFYLHSCGKVDEIMEDLIHEVGIDGKHSFQEDVAEVMDYKNRWGDELALLGGVDMNKLANFEPGDLRNYTRKIIDKCSEGGKFAIGSGNSIPSYIPVENYLTMIDEAINYSP